MTKPSCCENTQWVLERDLGHAYSFDFILGKCLTCSKYSMHVFCVATAKFSYEPVMDDDLIKIQSLPDGREMKQLMKDWFDVNC